MSADTYPHPNAEGPSGVFECLGRIAAVREALPGQFSLLVSGGKVPNFFVSLSADAIVNAHHLQPGQHVFSNTLAPQPSERLGAARGEVCNNRLFLFAPPQP